MNAFEKKKLRIELWLAVLLTIFGCVLLMCGFWISPQGVIDSSVLLGYGEVSTFAGSLLGIDYAKGKFMHDIKRDLNK